MVASTISDGFGRPSMETDDSPMFQEQTLSIKKFSNRFKELMKDLPNITKEKYECNQCGKQFGNQHILQLHTRVHESQSLLRGVPGATASLVNSTYNNGTLSFNFNITLDIAASDLSDASIKDRLSNILKNDTLLDNVSQSLAPSKSVPEVQKDKNSEADNGSKEEDETETKTGSCASPLDVECVNISADVSEPESSFGSNLENELSKESAETAATTPTQSQTQVTTPPTQSPVKPHHVTRGKKTVGLTKIRMEDCRRCDACSCIYMDERDYIKHMKNFHKHDIKSLPLERKEELEFRPFRHRQDSRRSRHSPSSPQRKERGCRSCCKQCKCRKSHDVLQPLLPILRPVLGRQFQNGQLQSAADDVLPSDIKDRWNKVVTQRLTENPSSLADSNDPDISHLLSQVEVKIKTEPVDMDSPFASPEQAAFFAQVKEETMDSDTYEMQL